MCFVGITSLILRCTFTGDGRLMLDLIAVSMMIPLVCKVVGKSEALYNGLRFIGVYSFLMWLTHSLFYIYDNRFIILMPKALTAWLVLGLLTLVLSIVLSEVFDAFYQLLGKIYLRKFLTN